MGDAVRGFGDCTNSIIPLAYVMGREFVQRICARVAMSSNGRLHVSEQNFAMEES